MMGSSSRSASGSGPPYLDPHRVYELLIRLSPREVLDYLDSIPGSSRDANCNRIRAVANALRALLSQLLRLSLLEESRRIQRWAQRARSHAEDSILCAPQIVGPSMLRHKSSSYSRRVLNRKPDNKELIHSAASSSTTPAANSLQEKLYDVHRHAATHDPLSASSSKNAVAMLPSLQANRMHRHASMHNPLYASNSRIQPAMPPLKANKKSISPRTREKAKGRMGSSSARCFRAPKSQRCFASWRCPATARGPPTHCDLTTKSSIRQAQRRSPPAAQGPATSSDLVLEPAADLATTTTLPPCTPPPTIVSTANLDSTVGGRDGSPSSISSACGSLCSRRSRILVFPTDH